jgi:hypothetical protein
MPQPAPETEEDMMVEIFKYTERVVSMVRPRKLLFMAIGEHNAFNSASGVQPTFSPQMVLHRALR